MSAIRKFGYSLGKLQSKRPWLFVMFAILLTIAMLPGIPMLLSNVEPSLEKVLPQDIPEVKLMNSMRSEYGADMVYIVLKSETDIFTYDNLKYINSLGQSLRHTENVLEVTSIADYMGDMPNHRHSIDLYLKDPRVASMLNKDRSTTYIMIRSDTGASAKQVQKLMDDIRFVIFTLEPSNPGIESELTGFNAIDNATFKVIVRDFSLITLISFALMILYLLLHYKFSIKKTVYSFVIMVLSLLWALGLTGYLGIKLNVVTMVSAAMIMALGSSYGINSVYHFYDDFLLQYDRKEAIAKFQEFLIIGLTGSALAEIAGFMALTFGIMPSMGELGIILAIGISFALIASVIVLPVLFYLMERD